MSTHSKECQSAIDQRSSDIAAWEIAWPNHCKTCHGWGGFYSTYDPSPSGVSLGPGTMDDFDTCPDCSDRDLCPRCGVSLPHDFVASCKACGWTTDTPGRPEPAECTCWTFDEPSF